MKGTNIRPLLMLAAALAAVSSCRNHAPAVPPVPTGPKYCFKDTTYTFTTIVAEADDESVAIRFDWGDSKASDWSAWSASGDTIALAHAWSDTGTYEVRAWAQNRKQRTSDTSGALAVRVALRRSPDAPARPVGPDSAGRGASCTFTAAAAHPNGIAVAIRFDWGDGDTSDWSSFVGAGQPAALGHAWSAPGVHAVTAQATDAGNALSQWSSPCSITIRPDTLKWRCATGGAILSSPAIGTDGTVYVGSYDEYLYAVNTQGVLRWRYQAGDMVRFAPAIAADGTVYFGSDDGYLIAVRPDGSLKWQRAIGMSVTSSPAIGSGGNVYVGSDDGNLYAFTADGTLDWQYPIPWGMVDCPAIAIAADGTLYFGSKDSVHAVNADGTTRWRCRVGGYPGPAAIATDGTIYVGSRDSGLYAINPNGTAGWRYHMSSPARNEPAIGADGTIYLGSSDGVLYAVNPDGTLKWSYATGGSVSSTPAVAADGTIYFGSDDTYIYAIDSDGAMKWRYPTGSYVRSSPAVAADGTIYIGSSDEHLYALWGSAPLADSPWPKLQHDLKNTGRVGGGR